MKTVRASYVKVTPKEDWMLLRPNKLEIVSAGGIEMKEFEMYFFDVIAKGPGSTNPAKPEPEVTCNVGDKITLTNLHNIVNVYHEGEPMIMCRTVMTNGVVEFEELGLIEIPEKKLVLA